MVLGGYTIEKQLGQGCMGPIYLATGPVVIRAVELDDSEPEIFEMHKALLLRHGRLLSGLRHPGVAPLREQFFEGKSHYFVFDYVEGSSLQEMPKPMPLLQVFQLADQLCAILEYLHGHDPPVIVRDLKPASLLVEPQGQLVVVDFGVGGIRNDQGEKGYAPPEQFGSIGTDARSDVYSLGAVLYTLLTDEVPPWSVELASGKAQLFPPDTHRPLADVVMNMLALRRSNRYPTVRDARLALAQIREVCLTSRPEDWEPVEPRPISAVLLLGAVQAGLLGCLGLFVYGKLKPVPPSAPRPVVRVKADGRSYADLLARPEELGFLPAEAGYNSLLSAVRQVYVNEVTDGQLRKGLLDELSNFLAQSRQNPAALSGLQRMAPGRAFQTFTALWPGPLTGYVCYLGVLRALNDPSAALLLPAEWQRVELTFSGGVGLVVEQGMVVIRALEGGPAQQAGILPGDEIVAVDGRDTAAMPLDFAQALIRGEPDSTVSLTVDHGGARRECALKRAVLSAASVNWKLLEDGVGYLGVAGFAPDTGALFAQGLKELSSARALVIDLRNAGGQQPQALLEMFATLLPVDTLVYATSDRRQNRSEYCTSSGGALDRPAVVLINGFTAAGGEMAARAFQDHKLARLVGQRTFGRARLEQFFELDGGPRVKLTVAHYLGPAGGRAEAVEPDLPTPPGEELERALELLVQ